jgi:diguanylate cyclase (GGDEF)-like protein
MRLKISNFTLACGAIVIFISLISIFVSLAINRIENDSRENIHQSLKTVLQTTQGALHLWIEEQLKVVSYAAANEEIKKLTYNLLQEYRNNSDLLKSKSVNNIQALMANKYIIDHYKGFSIIANNRITLASMQNENIYAENIINIHRKYYLDRVFSGETIFIPTILSTKSIITTQGQQTINLSTIYIAAPIIDDNNKIIAAITLSLNPMKDFTRIMKLGRVGKTGESYAFDKRGFLLTKSRFNEDLRNAGELSQDDVSMMTVRITDPGVNLQKQPSLALTRIKRPLTFMAEKAISGNFLEHHEPYRDYRGVKVFGVWLWDKVLDVGITTEIDAQEAFLPHEKTKRTIYIVLFFIILLSIGLMILFFVMKTKESKLLNQHRMHLERLVKERTLALEQANITLKNLSETDPLTQIANRRSYDKQLSLVVLSAKRTKQPLSLLVLDIDYFKAFNDHYGHDAGDGALKIIAQHISSTLPRATDFIARYGGEEFVALLPSTDIDGAYSVAERIRSTIELSAITHEFSGICDFITVSIGIAVLTENISQVEDLFKQADKALYEAKAKGRNNSFYFQSDE